MKKRISILLMLVMLFTTVGGVFAAGEKISVNIGGKTSSYPEVEVAIDGKVMDGDMPAILYGSTTMMPVRFITEGIGGEVEWNEAKQEVTIKLKSKVIAITIGSSEAVVDGVKKYIPEGKSPVLMNGRTMVPLRFVSEQFGAEVEWHNDTKSVTVKTDRVGTGLEPEESTSELKTVAKQNINGREAIVIKNSKAVNYTHFKLDSSAPTRIVIDIPNSSLSEGEKSYSISTGAVDRVRTGNSNNVSRVVLDIKPAVKLESYDIQKSGNDLVVYTEGEQKLFYEVYQNDDHLGTFNTESEAIAEAKKWRNSTVLLGGTVVWSFADNISSGKKTIVIDPGHGGSDSGALSYSRKYKEKDLVLNVGLKLEKKLKDRGYNVIMTRRTDVYPTLSERAQIANNANADGFISIHFNAATPAATGLETFYASMVSGGIKGTNDYQFAKSIQDQLMAASPNSRDRGVKQEQYAVLRLTKGYAALAELGFITNPSDEERLASDSYHELSAEAMAKGIDNFFKK